MRLNNLMILVAVLLVAGCVHTEQFPAPDIETIVQQEMDWVEKSVITINEKIYKVEEMNLVEYLNDSIQIWGYIFDNNQTTLYAALDIEEETATVTMFSGNMFEWSEEEIEARFGNPLFEGDLKVVEEIKGQHEGFIFQGELSNAQEKISVSFPFNEELSGAGSSKFSIEGAVVVVNGTLGTRTYLQLKDVIENYPEVKTVVLDQVPGSLNDFVNMHTGFLLRDANLNTKILSTSEIDSGGVDLFAAGVKRIAEEGARVGIHSWCCSAGKTADELSPDDPAHRAQLTYFRRTLGEEQGPGFYFSTLKAAPFDSIHYMTKEEMLQWNLVTDFIE